MLVPLSVQTSVGKSCSECGSRRLLLPRPDAGGAQLVQAPKSRVGQVSFTAHNAHALTGNGVRRFPIRPPAARFLHSGGDEVTGNCVSMKRLSVQQWSDATTSGRRYR